MSDEPRTITDDMLLSELTVGEFKQLMYELSGQIQSTSIDVSEKPAETEEPAENIVVRRKSLDEFMSDLGA